MGNLKLFQLKILPFVQLKMRLNGLIRLILVSKVWVFESPKVWTYVKVRVGGDTGFSLCGG